MATPDPITWALEYWPLLLAIAGAAWRLFIVESLVKQALTELKAQRRWIAGHRHNADSGEAYLPGDAIG